MDELNRRGQGSPIFSDAGETPAILKFTVWGVDVGSGDLLDGVYGGGAGVR